MTILFVHGGGDDAYAWDNKIVDRLQKLVDEPIGFPHLSGLEALDWPATAKQLGDALRPLPPRSVVVAHSVGAPAVLKLMAEGTHPSLAALLVLAAPYNGADGEWGDSDFSFRADFTSHLPRGLPITLWHNRDDDIIPVASAERYREKLGRGTVHIREQGGHQFDGPLDFLADAIRGATT